jgi:hypothetical protein
MMVLVGVEARMVGLFRSLVIAVVLLASAVAASVGTAGAAVVVSGGNARAAGERPPPELTWFGRAAIVKKASPRSARPVWSGDVAYCPSVLGADLWLKIREEQMYGQVVRRAQTYQVPLNVTWSPCQGYDRVTERSRLRWRVGMTYYRITVWVLDDEGAASAPRSKSFRRAAGIR